MSQIINRGMNQLVNKFAGKVTAPEFPVDVDWINTNEPIRMADLKGKLVLLDFWTYC